VEQERIDVFIGIVIRIGRVIDGHARLGGKLGVVLGLQLGFLSQIGADSAEQ